MWISYNHKLISIYMPSSYHLWSSYLVETCMNLLKICILNSAHSSINPSRYNIRQIYQIRFLWLPHEMGMHYVFMLILKFFDLSEIFYRSGRVIMSTLWIRGCPSVCRQIKLTSTQKVTSLFLRFMYIWIKQEVEKKSYEEKI